MISARGIGKLYRDGDRELRVLDRLDLEVKPGEMVAVVGPSGSGKSTLLHVLGGLDADYQGEVTVASTPLNGLPERALAGFRSSKVGFVFQSFHLVPNLPAVENVRLPGYFSSSRNGAEQSRRAVEVLTRVGLSDKKDRLPSQLSGGERQRVAIARAIFARPQVLFCDEPTGNLDAVTGREIIELFQELNREGLTVLAVTHEERMSAAAQRVLRLQAGRLVPEGGAR